MRLSFSSQGRWSQQCFSIGSVKYAHEKGGYYGISLVSSEIDDI